MENKFKVIKNGLCLTFDNFRRTGYYNIVLKGNKIFDVDYNGELSKDNDIYRKFPDVEIVDASNKIILPSFFNSFKNSTYELSDIFLKNLSYDDLDSDISLRLINKHLGNSKSNPDFINLLTISYVKSLLNGETFLNESSKLISAEFLTTNSIGHINVKPDIIFNTYNIYISDYCLGVNRFHCIGLKGEEDLNNYTISSIRKNLQRGNKRFIVESFESRLNSERLRKLFGKSFIRVLEDNDLLSPNLIFANPVYLTNEEINLINGKKINIILSPSDWLKFSVLEPEFNRFINKDFNILIGSGVSGKGVLSELKILSNFIGKQNVSSELLMKMLITNPATTFGISNICGSLEKNKLANLIMLDLNDVRNFVLFPEIDTELVCNFIINSLDEKDISDIFFRGLHFLEKYKCEYVDNRLLFDLNINLSKTIIDKGKYAELKNNKLVKEIYPDTGILGRSTATDMTEENEEKSSDITSESEFKIIGTKKIKLPIDENENYCDDEINQEYVSLNIKELTNMNNGLSLFSDYLNETKIEHNRIPNQNTTAEDKKPTKKLFFDEVSGESITEDLKKTENIPVTTKQASDFKKESDKPVFKKNKMRFGFDDEYKSSE